MTAPRINLSDSVIERMTTDQRKSLKVKTRSEINAKLEEKAEKVIQNEVESWLRHNGFWPRSPAFLDGKVPPRGWYTHTNKAKGNPLTLDLTAWTLEGGNVLELELKTLHGTLRPHQRVILDTTPCAKLARSTEEAIEIIREWFNIP